MKMIVFPGDGIGPEITDATLAVLAAANRRFDLGLDFEHHEIGVARLADGQEPDLQPVGERRERGAPPVTSSCAASPHRRSSL